MSGWRKGYAVTCIGLADNRYEERAERDPGRRCPMCRAWVGERCVRCEGPDCREEAKTGNRPPQSVAHAVATIIATKLHRNTTSDPFKAMHAVDALPGLTSAELISMFAPGDDHPDRRAWRVCVCRLVARGWLARGPRRTLSISPLGREAMAIHSAKVRR